MRKISDLVITLENEKGEGIKIRTRRIDEARKNLGHWKEPEEIQVPKQFHVSLNIRSNIYSRSDTTRNINVIPRSVPTES